MTVFRRPEVIAALVGLTVGIEVGALCVGNHDTQQMGPFLYLWTMGFLPALGGALGYSLRRRSAGPLHIVPIYALAAGVGFVVSLGRSPGFPHSVAGCVSAVIIIGFGMIEGGVAGFLLRGLANLTRNGISALTRFLKGAPQRP